MPEQQPWYEISNIDELDSPALVIYKERVKKNIQLAIEMVGEVYRLRPHVKTHKSADITRMMMEAGITKFKCATIAEAEMLASVGAPDVLLAYPVTGPKIQRLIKLMQQYPSTEFSCLVDNTDAAVDLGNTAKQYGEKIRVWVDINTGMNRTGVVPGDAIKLFECLISVPFLQLIGLHAYDGHITVSDLAQRTKQCNESYSTVDKIKNEILARGYPDVMVVAGGSPTFPIHAKRKEVECSPGTFVFWDASYLHAYPEQHFLPAALVITRIISYPGDHLLCTDLGHKSIAAENPLNRRLEVINAEGLEFISQSEEHLVVKYQRDNSWSVGDVLYCMPIHICPTCALYERAAVIENHRVEGEWKIVARDRKIKI